ncbi:MAG TPA: cellulase family glycosylhydrolase [Ohtaekwangia sp.]
MIKAILSASVIFLLTFSTSAQNREPAFEMNAKLGRGMNMGNCFEAPSETEWGNPWKPEYFRIMADLGFQHVRLPVRWEPAARSQATAPYTITPAFMERIQAVVDTALKYDLHIIVNMHHHEALYEDPAGQKERFLSMWEQIADHFKNYPDKLLFEVLNEPHGNVTPEVWNEYFADALAVIRETNSTRVVLMGVADYGGLGGISKLELPDDEYIILSPHYYNPFNFTHQGAEWVDGADAWMGTKWNDTEADRATVESEFSFALQFSEANHIPIHVGEFGAYSTADIESRERWTTFLARWFEEKNMSWAYWEFSAGFGIYNPATQTLLTPLVEALLTNEMPEPVPVIATPVYTSNFNSGMDGWSLSAQAGASGSLAASAGRLNVSITNGGTQGWHVQLVRNNIPLVKDKLYRISFKAVAPANRSATFYAGKASDPWNAYSGYNALSAGTLESSFTYSFTMINPTDMNARLVFDLGTSAIGLSIWDVKVEELKIGEPEIPTSTEEKENSTRTAYPNPVHSVLYVEEVGRYTSADVYDLHGRKQINIRLSPKAELIDLQSLPRGFYVVRFNGMKGSKTVKILKE